MSRKDELRAARAALGEARERYQELKASGPNEELETLRGRLVGVKHRIRQQPPLAMGGDATEKLKCGEEVSALEALIRVEEAKQRPTHEEIEEAKGTLKKAESDLRHLLMAAMRDEEGAVLSQIVKAVASVYDVLDDLDGRRTELKKVAWPLGVPDTAHVSWRALLDALWEALGEKLRFSPSALVERQEHRKFSEKIAAKERAVNEAAERAHLEAVSRASGAGEKARRFARERLKELKA